MALGRCRPVSPIRGKRRQVNEYRLSSTLSPNQSIRTVVALEHVDAKVDLCQDGLVGNLGKLLDNQPDSVEPVADESIELPGNAASASAYTRSRSTFRTRSLRQAFPTISFDQASTLFPLIDPLDIDVQVQWSLAGESRSGLAFAHAVRAGPEFSIVESLRRKVDAAIASGSKQTRTMYEETGRLRKLLLDSVLDGHLAREDDPVLVRAYLPDAKGGVAACDVTDG